jgi:hypothetical protein
MSIFVHRVTIFGTPDISQEWYAKEIQGVKAILWKILQWYRICLSSYSTLDCTLPPLSLVGRPRRMSHELFMDEWETQDGTEPSLSDPSSSADYMEQDDEELLAISNIVVEFKNLPLQGSTEQLEVVAQSGKTVTIALSPAQNSLISTLKLGSRFPQTQFFSPVAVFRAPCFVSKVSRVGSSPERESYLVDITVESG